MKKRGLLLRLVDYLTFEFRTVRKVFISSVESSSPVNKKNQDHKKVSKGIRINLSSKIKIA